MHGEGGWVLKLAPGVWMTGLSLKQNKMPVNISSGSHAPGTQTPYICKHKHPAHPHTWCGRSGAQVVVAGAERGRAR